MNDDTSVCVLCLIIFSFYRQGSCFLMVSCSCFPKPLSRLVVMASTGKHGTAREVQLVANMRKEGLPWVVIQRITSRSRQTFVRIVPC